MVSDTISSILGSAASALTQAAVGTLAYIALPAPGQYAREIASLQEVLLHKTGGPFAREVAKTITNRFVHKLTYHLSTPEKLVREDTEKPLLENYVYYQDGRVHLNTVGKSFLTVLTNHRELVQETFELNLLRALKNGISFIEEQLQDNPNILVDIVSEAMAEFCKEMDGAYNGEAELDHARFMEWTKSFIIGKLFPNGSMDIEIPISLQGYINARFFMQLQEKTLPHLLNKTYTRATSEITKYKILAKGLNFLAEAQIPAAAGNAPARITPYPIEKQQLFKERLVACLSRALPLLQNRTITRLQPTILLGVARFSPKLVDKIASINIQTLLNKLFKGICKTMNHQGSWVQENGEDRFRFVGAPQRNATEKADRLRITQARNQAYVDYRLETMAEDIKGILKKLKPQKPAPPSSTVPQTHLEALVSKIAHVARVIRHATFTFCIKLASKLLDIDKKAVELSQAVLFIIQDLPSDFAVKPLKRKVLQSLE